MLQLQLYYSYLLVLLIATITSLKGTKVKSIENILLSILLFCTLISEISALILIMKYNNNSIGYHIFNPIQFLIICLYYNRIIPEFRKYHIGIIIGIVGLFLGVINSLFLQELNTFNTNYLLFESVSIIMMSLHFFYSLLKTDKANTLNYQHFWVCLTFLLFWSITYTNWGLVHVFSSQMYKRPPILSLILISVNILTYSSFVVIFILTKKNKLSQ